jgi:hypothetical protein
MFRRLVWVAATAVSLVAAHDLTFLARYGSAYGEALAHAGHGAGWDRATATLLALAALIAVVAAARLRAIARGAGELVTILPTSRSEARRAQAHDVARAWLLDWLRLSTVVMVLLTVQENLERALAGLAPPGVLALTTPEYAFGWLLVLAVAAAVAAVLGLYRWRRAVLLARIRPRSPRVARADPIRPTLTILLHFESLLGRRGGLRAPPLTVA